MQQKTNDLKIKKLIKHKFLKIYKDQKYIQPKK